MHIVLLALLLGCVGGEGGDRGSGSSQASLPTGLTVLDVWEVTPDALRSPQHHPALDLDQSDTLAVTWDEETNPPGAYLRLFDPSGMALSEFQRFTMCPEDVPCRPDIVAAGGRFWIGWADDEGVKLARFDASLERDGDTVLLEATPEGERLEAPDLASLPDGSVVATWFGSDRLEGGETARYRLVRVTPDGVVQPRTELDVGLAGGSPPDVTSTDRGAAVVWVARESGDDGIVSSTVWLAELDEQGGELTRLPIWTTDTVATRPMVAAAGADRAITWREDRPERVSLLQLRPSGAPPHPPLLLDDGRADKPVVQMLQGRAVVAFDVEPAPTQGRVYLQTFDMRSAAPLHPPHRVWGKGGGEQRPALGTDGDTFWVAFREEPEGTGTPGTIRVARCQLD